MDALDILGGYIQARDFNKLRSVGECVALTMDALDILGVCGEAGDFVG